MPYVTQLLCPFGATEPLRPYVCARLHCSFRASEPPRDNCLAQLLCLLWATEPLRLCGVTGATKPHQARVAPHLLRFDHGECRLPGKSCIIRVATPSSSVVLGYYHGTEPTKITHTVIWRQ